MELTTKILSAMLVSLIGFAGIYAMAKQWKAQLKAGVSPVLTIIMLYFCFILIVLALLRIWTQW